MKAKKGIKMLVGSVLLNITEKLIRYAIRKKVG